MSVAQAQLPTGPQVVHGNVAISQAGGAMTVQQSSPQAIVNWQSFNIGAGNQLRLQQAGADAAMLARVTGGDPSKLLGSLQADGKLFLINPKGIVVGAGATIDTAGFMASTLDVADRDFLAGGPLTFQGSSTASVVNLGQIAARDGNVMLFAHTVKNAGTISAPQGTAGLAAASEVYLASPNDGAFVVKLNLPASTETTGVENSGVVEAAQARLQAAGGGIYDLAVNQSGFVRATGVETKNGRVILTADGGTVGVSGEVTARNANGSGGEILVGGDYRGGNASVPNAARTVVAATAKLDASATTANGAAGRAIVWGDDATRFLGTLTAKGSRGGFAEISGAKFLDFRPARPVDLGTGGTLLLDPTHLFVRNMPDTALDDVGGNPFVFRSEGHAQLITTLSVATLQAQLQSTSVILDTSGTVGRIVIESPVTWSNTNTLRLTSGNQIEIGANITAPNGRLELFSGRYATLNPGNDGPDLMPHTIADGAITVNTLVVGANGAATSPVHTLLTPHRTGTAIFNGNLNVGTLTVDLTAGGAGVLVQGDNNAIGTFRTSGTGDLRSAYVIDHQGDLDVEIVSTTSTADSIRIVTPGTLKLLANTALNFGSETNVILASTGGAFVNNATLGGNVFGANGRYLIYSNSVAATTKGGLGGVNVFNHPYNPTDLFPDSTRRFFFTATGGLPVLNYRANNATRIYGDSNPAFAFTVTGEVSTHPIATSVTGTPSFTTTATQSSGVGSYAINIGLGSLFSTAYEFSFTPGLLSVTRAPLMITANNLSRHLNHPNPTLTASYAGLVNGDTSAVVSGLQLSTTANLNSPSGTYPITVSGGTAANYTIEFVNGRLTIGDLAPLTITANSASRLYGAANPVFSATFNGLVSGHDSSVVNGLQFSTTATQSSGVGSYAITPFGASATGYNISYVPGTLAIERAPLTITANHASRVYGDANPAFSAQYFGLVNGDTAGVVSGLTFNAPGTAANAGFHEIMPTGATTANYAISYLPGRLQVTKAPVTFRADDKTRVYGDANPTLTYTVTGLKNGDAPETAGQITQLVTLANERDQIGLYGIFLNGFSASPNYDVTFQSGSLRITQRPITIAADNLTKVYGDPFPSTYPTTITGLPSFATPDVIPDVKASLLASVTDGVQTVGIGVTSGLNQNYAISYKLGQLTITPATLLLGAPPESVRIYGQANPVVSLESVGGLKHSDTVSSIGLSLEFPALTANVGTYSYGYKLTSPNYRLPDVGTGVFHVEPAPLDVQIGSTGRLYGDANPALSLAAGGLAFGQTAGSVLSLSYPETFADVGVYNVVPSLTSSNYYLRSVSGGRLQINPRWLTFEIDNIARYYADENPAFTYRQVGRDGLAPFDSIETVFRGLKTAVDVTAQTNVGVYRIDPIFAPNANYVVSWSPGYLAIIPRPITLTINNAIAFGNDNAPAGFSTAGSTINWVKRDPANPGSGRLTGFTATTTNLPSGVSLADIFPQMGFTTSLENKPVPVDALVDLDKVFPPRPTPAAPQAPSAPPPEGWVAFTHHTIPADALKQNQVTSQFESQLIVVIDAKLITNPTSEQKKRERFSDQTLYVTPTGLANSNYAVTKINAGVLTMKADQKVVAATLAAEERVAKLNAARKAFLNPPIGTKVAMGLPRDMIPMLRYALVNAINQEFLDGTAGQVGSLARLVFGGVPGSFDDITDEQLVMFFKDIHTNPEKQLVMIPVMMHYTMALATKDPAQQTAQEAKLLSMATPFIKQGRKEFVASAQAAHDRWQTANEALRSSTMAGMYGLQVVPYEKFVSAAVEESVTRSMTRLSNQFEHQAPLLTNQEIAGYTGMTIGGAAGGAGGLAVEITLGATITKIMPNAKRDVLYAVERLKLAQNKLAQGGQKAATQAAQHIDDAVDAGTKAFRSAGAMGKAIAGATQIVTLAIDIAITQGMRVGEETEQRAKFEALMRSGSDAVNPREMMKTEVGRAEMMLGLMAMFTGGVDAMNPSF